MSGTVDIEPKSVKTNLTNFANKYPKYCNGLNTINTQFGGINKFWKGDRYKRIMHAWVDEYDNLNKTTSNLATSSSILNGVLRAYTSADEKPISLEPPAKITLTKYKVDPSTKIQINYAGVKSCLNIIDNQAKVALQAAKDMKEANLNAKWSDDGDAIDTAKKKINKALDDSIDYFDKLIKAVKQALTDAEADFKTAGNSYKG